MIKKPMVLVLAGPNGSGKSTITDYFEKIGKYTNADEIVSATGMDNKEAAQLVDDMRYESIRNHEDFTFETVLSSDYKLKILQEAREQNYFIKCIFVLTVDPNINVGRVQARVASGGHDVSKADIVRRYHKSISNIKKLIDICDILHVYDNTGEAPVRIIRKHKDDLSVFPNEIWAEEDILKLIDD